MSRHKRMPRALKAAEKRVVDSWPTAMQPENGQDAHRPSWNGSPAVSRGLWDRRILLVLLLMIGPSTGRPSFRLMAFQGQLETNSKPPQPSALKTVSATPDIPFTEFDSEAERLLLDLTNQARAQAGEPALTLDPGLSQAARAHAEADVSRAPAFAPIRPRAFLAATAGSATTTLLDQEGENVALDFDAEDGQRHLMLSPPHRANLLNPATTSSAWA